MFPSWDADQIDVDWTWLYSVQLSWIMIAIWMDWDFLAIQTFNFYNIVECVAVSVMLQ